jgi:predicted nucleic acid-binding protein
VNAVFADTFFYLALLNERDPAHAEALAHSRVRRPS